MNLYRVDFLIHRHSKTKKQLKYTATLKQTSYLCKKERRNFMEQALNPVDWYMKLLAPLSPDIKLDLISKLSESLKDTHTHSKKISSKSSDFFSALSGAWEDDTSVEDEVRKIRESRTSNQTRIIDEF